MAKKSVLLYADMLDIIDEMENAEIAEILKAIRAYILGEEYEFKSRIAKLSFMPILRQFERDAEKYNSIVQKRTDAVRKRWDRYHEQNTDEEEGQTEIFDEPPIPPPIKKSAHNADYDWVDDSLRAIFAEWLDYKRREKKGTYKTEATVRKCYNDLVKMSANNPELAREMVDKAIASGWTGLHEIKDSNSGSSKTKHERQTIANAQLGNKLNERCRAMLERERAGESEFVPPPL